MNEPVFILTGPSGSGKTTVCQALLKEWPERLAKPVSVTTREPRTGEVHGRDYYFVSAHGFSVMERRGDFLETSIGNGQHYGLLKRELEKIVERGLTPLIVCDTEGVDNYHALGIPHRAVFLDVDRGELISRIRSRGEINPAELEQRLERAWREYDWCQRRIKKNYNIKLVRNMEDRLENTISQVKQCFGLT